MPRYARNDGFTLAEVLITLVIIGVIAAITVPTLINKTNNQETVSKLKKAYSTLAQATNLIIAEEGTPNADKGGWATNSENLYNLYKKYLNNAKECGNDTGCFQQHIGDIGYAYLNGTGNGSNWDNGVNQYRLVLADGVQIQFVQSGTNTQCGYNAYGSTNFCAWINVDINGHKKPNVFGRDVYTFVLKEKGLYPSGCDTATCPNSNGLDCACKVLREGAMNY